MHNEIYIEEGSVFLRGALVEDDRIVELFFESQHVSRSSLLGSIYLGRIESVASHMQAAFVGLTRKVTGFLHERHAQHHIGKRANDDNTMASCQLPIESSVHEGELVLVQVRKDAHGEKGPQVTTDITLAGRFIILAPARKVVTVSRHITNKKVRNQLKRFGKAMQRSVKDTYGLNVGFVLRTSASGADEQAIREDLDALLKDWRAILAAQKTAQSLQQIAPPENVVHRILRNHLHKDTRHVRVVGKTAVQDVQTYVKQKMPEYLSKVVPLRPSQVFDQPDMNAHLDMALASRVDLPSGGWISIEPTEALVAIDVNTGEGVIPGRGNAALQTNLEAAKEIARQLRLRRLGGVIVIDFIHMTGAQHGAHQNAKVREALVMAFARDPASINVGAISQFGLLTMTRARSEETLAELLLESVPTPQALVISAMCVDIALRAAERELHLTPTARITLALSRDLSEWLDGEGQEIWARTVDFYGGRLRRDLAAHLDRGQYEVIHVKKA